MSKYLHKVHLKLYKNPLTTDPNDYSARTTVEHVYDVSDISHMAETRGSSGVKADEMTRIVNLWFKEMAYQMCDDNAINTGYFQAKLHTQGVFKSATDTYDPERHKLLFEFQQGKLLRDELELVDVVVDGVADTAPLVDVVYDYGSDTTNEKLTPGGAVDIKGFTLKFLPEQADNGIFLVPATGSDAIKLAPVLTNTPQHLIVNLPANLAEGDYRLEVRTSYTPNGTPLKSLKVGKSAPLSVGTDNSGQESTLS